MTKQKISIQAGRSRRLLMLVSWAHLIAAIVASATPVAGWWLLCVWLMLSFSLCWQLVLLRRQHASFVLEITTEGSCRWQTGGQDCAGTLRADSTVLPWLIVLRMDIRGSWRVRQLLLLPDSMSASDWHRLRVFLRWGVRFGAASEPSGGLR